MSNHDTLRIALNTLRTFLLPRWQAKHAHILSMRGVLHGGPVKTQDRAMCRFTAVFVEAALPMLGIDGFEYAEGRHVSDDEDGGYLCRGHWYAHAWLTNGDTIIDITATQFGDVPVVFRDQQEATMYHDNSLEEERECAYTNTEETVFAWLDEFRALNSPEKVNAHD